MVVDNLIGIAEEGANYHEYVVSNGSAVVIMAHAPCLHNSSTSQ